MCEREEGGREREGSLASRAEGAVPLSLGPDGEIVPLNCSFGNLTEPYDTVITLKIGNKRVEFMQSTFSSLK